MDEKGSRSPVVWDPFADLETFSRWPFRGRGRPSRLLEDVWEAGRSFAPAVDISENDSQYTVTAELAGTKKEDVTVELHDGMLTIRGEKRTEHKEEGEKRRHVERTYGTFSRSFSMPVDADPDRIDAQFQDGVLTVTIAKTDVAKPKTVDIKG